MSYGLYKISEFTGKPLASDAQGQNYYLEIYKKDYTGDHGNVDAAATPVLHNWQPDDPYAPVRGSALDIKLHNAPARPCHLTDFLSNEDDTFLVVLKWDSQVLFKGFLVQDDCTEDFVDKRHEISLKATDNLGLLKDVSLHEASRLYGSTSTSTETIETFYLGTGIKIYNTSFVIAAGDTLVISGTGTAADGIHFINQVGTFVGFIQVIADTMLNAAFLGSANVTVISPVDLTEKQPISELLRLCLLSTGLELNTKLYATIYPDGGSEDSFITASFLEPQSFLHGDKWDSCHTVLENIMERFNATVMQVEGNWIIIRQHERRYYNYVPGIEYDPQFAFVGNIALNNLFTAGIGEETRGETTLQQSIFRNLKYAKETFNYSQPANLLRNADMQDLGNLISVASAPGGNTYSYYELVDWSDGSAGNAGTWSIRVHRTPSGTELDRIIVIGNSGQFASVARSYPIEVRAGDRLKLSFDVRTSGSQVSNGTINNDFRFEIQHGANPTTDYRRLANDHTWNLNPLFKYYWTNGINTNTWNTVGVESNEILFDGLLYIYLSQADITSGETHYKNIRFEVVRQINGSNKIIGQTHKDSQALNIKNSDEHEIKIDDSPSNAIAGTLFLSTTAVLIRDLTTKWQLIPGMSTPKALGEITTHENLFAKRIMRTKMEGSFKGLVQNSIHLSLLTLFKYTYFNSLNFCFGRCEIDYRRNSVSGTIWEVFTDDERELTEILDTNAEMESTAPNTLIFDTGLWAVRVGDIIVISTGTIAGTYTVAAVTTVGSDYHVTTAEPIITMAPTSVDFVASRYIAIETLLADTYEFKYLYEK